MLLSRKVTILCPTNQQAPQLVTVSLFLVTQKKRDFGYSSTITNFLKSKMYIIVVYRDIIQSSLTQEAVAE